MATNLGVFRFQPLAGEDTIANDGSSFGAPYLSQARSMLQGIRVLALTPETITYPENYELDAVQGEREDHFEAKEWILAAITGGSSAMMNLPFDGISLEDLRLTNRLLLGSGADIKTVQQRLGHSSASLTMDIYAHFIAQNDRAAANTIGGILGEAVDKPSAATDKPVLSDADKAAIAQRIADGASLEAAISAVRPDVSVLELLGL